LSPNFKWENEDVEQFRSKKKKEKKKSFNDNKANFKNWENIF
jgi:hypothetical protein